MIAIILKDINFEQDIREIMLAFFPNETISYQLDYECKYFIVINGKKLNNYLYFSIEIQDENDLSYHKFHVDALQERIDIKTDIKKNLYNIIKELYNLDLPWGTLTGIRPTKLVMEYLEKDYNIDYIRRYFSDKYLLTGDRLDLCIDTAKNEYNIIKNIDELNSYSLYIGIPFCPTTCAYCSFSAYPIIKWQYLVDNYVESLIKELAYIAKINKNKKLMCIYFGGGTPTSLNEYQLEKIISFISKNFDLSYVKEYCIEAGRPDTIDKDKLTLFKRYNVSRISINPQSMNDDTLRKIGRNHNAKMIIDTYKQATDVGLDNINMDIIAGLYGEDINHMMHTIDEIIKLKPNNITIHTLAIKRAAKLNTNKYNYEQYKSYSDDKKYNVLKNMLDYAYKQCSDNGYRPYYLYRQKNMAGNFENVGFAKKGYECLYNILIMEERHDIIACGAGASSKLVLFDKAKRQVQRIENIKDPKLYIERIDEIIKNKEKILGRI